MSAFKRRIALIDCGRVSVGTKGGGSHFSENQPWPFNLWG